MKISIVAGCVLALVAGTAVTTYAVTETQRQVDTSISGTIALPTGYWCRPDAHPVPGWSESCTIVSVPMAKPPLAMGVTVGHHQDGGITWEDQKWSSAYSDVVAVWRDGVLHVMMYACEWSFSDATCAAGLGGGLATPDTYRYWAILGL